MCERTRPRFLTLFHRMVMGDMENIPLDSWMDANVPEEYRVVSVMMDKIVTDEIIFTHTIVLELK
jgi:hypothetical protein